MQKSLIDRGYDLGKYGADGKFGAVTEKAVMDFQQDHGLSLTGIWSDAERAVLKPPDEANSEREVISNSVISLELVIETLERAKKAAELTVESLKGVLL
jgi:peptidoglycan hydrolase-like protein with peptidoglycan-binding domain